MGNPRETDVAPSETVTVTSKSSGLCGTAVVSMSAVVGVPLIVNVAPFAVVVSPLGGSPVTDQVKGLPLPPVAVRVSRYGWPTVASSVMLAVIVIGGWLTVMKSPQNAVCAGDSPSLTSPEAVDWPSTLGVPLMVSVAPFAVAVSPDGRSVTALQV